MRQLAFFLAISLLSHPVFCGNAQSAEELARAWISTPDETARAALLSESGVSEEDLFRALLAESDKLRIAANYRDAKSGLEFALRIAQKKADKLEISLAQFQLGKVSYYQSDYKTALEFFTQSLAGQENGVDPVGEALTLNFIGNVYRQQFDYKNAREYYKQSLAQAQQAGSKDVMARALNSLCLTDQQEEHYDTAAQECGTSLALRRELGDKPAIAETLVAQGRLDYLMERDDRALLDYQESLSLYQELQDPYYIEYLNASIGDIYYTQGNFVQALESFQSSLKMSRSQGDKDNTTYALRMIADIHDVQGNYDVALEYLQKALALYEGEDAHDLQRIYLQDLIGRVYLHKGQTREARQWISSALQMYEDLGRKRDMGFGHNELGELELQQGNYDAAVVDFTKSVELAKGLDSTIQATALKNLAITALSRGQSRAALDYAKQAGAFAAERNEPAVLWQALQIMGRAYSELGDSENARQALSQSIATLEDLRGKVAGGEEDRQRFLASRIGPYLAMIDFLISQKQIPQAFEYAERAKARVLLEALRGKRTEPEQFMTADERLQEKNLLERMSELNLKILKEKEKASPDVDVVLTTEAQLLKARNEHEAFFTNLYADHSEARLQRGEIPNISIRDAVEMIPDSETEVLEYVVTPERTYLFAVGSMGDSVRLFTIDLGRSQLSSLIEAFRGKVSSLDLDFSSEARRLYDILIGPAEPLLARKKNLLIIPDAEIWNVPFEALKTSENRYLIQNHVVLYVPSLAAFHEMLRIRRPDGSNAKNVLFAMANPVADSSAAAPAKELYRSELLSPLPDSQEEVNTLAGLYGRADSKIYIGKYASEVRFKTEAEKYSVLHIATHGILNNASPLYSQLVLSPGSVAGSEDGLLEAWEIMKLKLNARLAVLSACETGRGQIGSGEGVIGLSWAFLVAGVPTTVVSKWKVESTSTSRLMVDFHLYLLARPQGPFPIAEALRHAALEVMQQPNYKHPFYWAGFGVIGAGR